MPGSYVWGSGQVVRLVAVGGSPPGHVTLLVTRRQAQPAADGTDASVAVGQGAASEGDGDVVEKLFLPLA
ncbi:hypothetical protein [Streptomyces sp. NPDC048385]|uniref:hypothetical protein n=1 Tax=unclassified Streptomyces TaxID=2593676 RepID=UPI00343CC6BD